MSSRRARASAAMSSKVSICSARRRRPSSTTPIPATAASTASGRKTREKSGTTSAAPRPRRKDVGWICIVDLLEVWSGAECYPAGSQAIVTFRLRCVNSCCVGGLKTVHTRDRRAFDWVSFCFHTVTISRRARGGSPAMPRKAANQSRIFGGAETLSLELVHAVTETAVAAVRGAQEVGAEIGTTADGAVRGAVQAGGGGGGGQRARGGGGGGRGGEGARGGRRGWPRRGGRRPGRGECRATGRRERR